MKNKKLMVLLGVIAFAFALGIIISQKQVFEPDVEIKHVTGIILYKNEDSIIIEDNDKNIYEFDKDEISEKEGTEISVDYKENEKPPVKNPNANNSSSTKPDVPKPENPSNGDSTVIDYTVTAPSTIPDEWLDGGIYSAYYTKAYDLLRTMSLEEKIGQTLIVRNSSSGMSDLIKKYHVGGIVYFEVDFKTKSRQSVLDMISSAQSSSKIPLLTAIDEEGGTVSRISSNKELTANPFKSSQELYKEGGMAAIRTDVINKSNILKGLGLNLNFAPVVDVSTDPTNYIYKRTLGQGAALTSEYASNVISASKGLGVSYTLKHFPGYGSNKDTHVGSSVSQKSYDDLMNEDIPPFKEGIKAGAEAVMVSHNIVEAIDKTNESSISAPVHSLLRNTLGFTGVIITDDISMGAMKNVSNIGGKALGAGNDLIITSDVSSTFSQIKNSIENQSVKEEILDKAVFRILAWKYYKGLLF